LKRCPGGMAACNRADAPEKDRNPSQKTDFCLDSDA
jgi:hypothetical protein